MSYQRSTNAGWKVLPFTKDPLVQVSGHKCEVFSCNPTHFTREHLGLLGNSDGTKIVTDPVIRHFYEGRWMNTAVRNTIRLQRAFGGKCVPTDDVRNFAELAEFRVR